MTIDKERITNLFDATDRLFLMGAGCSRCACLPLMTELTKNVLEEAQGETKEILETIKGEVDGNIEDYLSQLGNYIAVASKRKDSGSIIKIGKKEFKKNELEKALQRTKK